MIPDGFPRANFESLELDKALRVHSPSRESSKILEGLARFCSLRQFIAAFYILTGIILFIGFVLSKDSLDDYNVVFDSVALIQVNPPSSPSPRPETIPSSTPTSPQKRGEREESEPPPNGLIIHGPITSAPEEPPSPPSLSSLPSSSALPVAPPPTQSPVPGESAVQFTMGRSPSWAANALRENFDASSLDLPESPIETKKEQVKNP